MTRLRNHTAPVILASLLLLFPGCRNQSGRTPDPLYIMLTFNAGNCEQNGSYGMVDVYENQAVIYQGAALLSDFQVRFSRCPFESCPVNSPHGTSENVGRPKAGTAGTTFNYSGITIDGNSCNGAANMGIRIQPSR
jgi:hypothetical protein